jgi:tetratricopeptide (TPR) repeat protein
LIEAATERNLWADRYERNLTSILALQGEVAQAIARQIQVTLTPTEENLLTRTRQVHPEAYEAYLKGQSHWYKLTPADLETALQYFDLALEKDSDYALAQVGIALVWCGRQQMGITPPQEAGPKARAAALRAVELDATLAEAHYVLAILKTWTDWDWKGGETSFRRAIELNPNYADVRAYYSHHLLIVGRPDEAAAQMERALELDPFNPLFHALNGVVLHCGSRRYDDAIEQFRIALRSVPNHPVALWGLEDAFYEKGMYKEAFEAAMTYFVTITGDPKPLETLERSYEQEGFKGAMSRLAGLWVVHSRSSPVSFSDPMGTYAYAGDADRALEWLERGFEERDPNVPYMFLVPGYDGLRKEPRFQDLQRRMNFPQEALSRSPNQTP